jgi:flagellar hook-length control protein FliK
MNGTGSVPSATTGVSAPGQAVTPTVPLPAGGAGGEGTGGTDATRGPDGLAAAARGGVGSLLDQISPVLVRQARLISVGETHQMTLRLSPESLGPVQVHIALGDGGLSVDLTATNANAHRALETALPQLRGSLADAGIRLERLDVGLRDSGNSSQNRNFAGNGGGDRGAGGNGGGAPGRQFGGQSGQSGPAFSDFLVDQDGQPFDVRLRQGGLSGVGLPGSSSPFNTGRATPGAFSRAGYGAYGALRSFISRGLRSRG